jgi:protein-tyrosine phosphatase
VLVICHGNLCRSPFAAAVLGRALPALTIASAGLAAGEGGAADPSAACAAARRGISLGAPRTRRVGAAELRGADLVLGMEGRHVEAALLLAPERRGRVRLLGEFLPAPPYTIPDPWGRDDAVFDQVFERIELAAQELVRVLGQRNA